MDTANVTMGSTVGDAGSSDAEERLLVVVAHPDDETFGTGSLLAHAAAMGVPAVVACATRGEAGDPVPGSVPEGVSLAAVRETELRDAATFLGVERVVVLDWADSGMEGDAADGTLVAAEFDSIVAAFVEVIDDVRPTIVVTLDASDGHRDHARTRDATLAAVRRCQWHVDRVYLHCLPQALMGRWVEALQERQPDAAHLALGDLGTPDDEITTKIDTSSLVDRREAAMALHASQRPPYDVMPPDLRRAFLETDQLRRVVPPWDGGVVERELFGRSGRAHSIGAGSARDQTVDAT